MSECGICGKKDSKIDALVEGVLLTVCSDCSKYGKVIKVKELEKEVKTVKAQTPLYPEHEELIVKDYAELIRKGREALNLTQEELAKRISEKESLIHHVESGSMAPSFSVAKKLERFLGITLIETQKLEKRKSNINFSDAGLTIGDLLKKHE